MYSFLNPDSKYHYHYKISTRQEPALRTLGGYSLNIEQDEDKHKCVHGEGGFVTNHDQRDIRGYFVTGGNMPGGDWKHQ